jgi:hypothetical protein
MPIESRVWDGNLLVKVRQRLVSVESEVPNTPPVEQLRPQMSVYYRDSYTGRSDVYRIAPTIANFIFLLAHTPTDAKRRQGLDLSYSQVVSALHEYSKLGVLEAPFEMELSPLVKQIASLTEDQEISRPDRDETSIDGDGSDEPAPNAPNAPDRSDGADRPDSSDGTDSTGRPDSAKGAGDGLLPPLEGAGSSDKDAGKKSAPNGVKNSAKTDDGGAKNDGFGGLPSFDR